MHSMVGKKTMHAAARKRQVTENHWEVEINSVQVDVYPSCSAARTTCIAARATETVANINTVGTMI